jgi:PE family
MSFVTAAPEEVLAAARNLAGIRSMLAQSSASAAAPTAGLVAAAADQVSAQVAAFFGAFGQDYQVISAQAQAFHAQFVNTLRGGAAAYLEAEVANAEQLLANAVSVPASGLLAQPGGAGIAGVATALRNGNLVPLLSRMPLALTGLGNVLAPAAVQTGAAGTSLASIAGPFQALFQHTAANLQLLGNAIAANPAPFLQQFVTNQIGYAQTIAAGFEYIVQNFPTVIANLPANIQAFIQALLAFNPGPYIQQFIANQMAYAQITATSLQNSAHDLATGLQALPAAFQSAIQALQAGDVAGAVTDIAQGFVGLLAPGVAVTTTGNISVPPGLVASITPTGTLGDLLPILTIPGMMAQNFTELLPPGSIPAQMSQNFTNVINTLTDTSLAGQVLFTTKLLPPPPSVTLSVNLAAGLPVALAIDALGAPYNAAGALGSSVGTFVGQLQTGNLTGALGTLVDGPAVVTDAFLNGQSALPLIFDLSGARATVNIPLNGILVPQTTYTASVTDSFPGIGPVTLTVPVGGTPLSGLATGLLVYAPEQLALAITSTG